MAAQTIPTAFTIEPKSGPNSTPFMIARASVTENGAEATTVKIRTASGKAKNPSVASLCSIGSLYRIPNAARRNDTTMTMTASQRRRNRWSRGC